MLRLSISVLLVCGAALFSAVAVAGGTQIYKWTDSQGVVHYSDKAPAQPQTSLTVMALPEPPPVDPKAEAADQAWIASVNQWYQSVLQQQSELQYQEFLAWEENQPPLAATTQQVSYVTPICWDCDRFRFHHHHFRPPLLSTPMPQSIHNSLWSTQPNSFNSSVWNTNPALLNRPFFKP
jgi:hypothetical protein